MYEYKAVLTNVVDGDTMDFVVDVGFNITHTIRVRLFGIDTPEIFHPGNEKEKEHGMEAKDFVIRNFLGMEGTLKTRKDKTGKYEGYLADFKCIYKPTLVEALIYNGFNKREKY